MLLPRQFLAAGFLRRHEDLHLRERERQETEILQEPAPCGQGIRRRVRNGLIMHTAAVGVAQKEDQEEGIDEEHILDRVVLFLAALIGLKLAKVSYGATANLKRQFWCC